MLQNIITSLLAFISTNIDDIFILMLFYGSNKFRKATILIGQFTGIGALVLISFVGSYIGNFIDQRYIGLLGLFPIYLAIRQTIEVFRHSNDEDNDDSPNLKSSGILAIAGVTIANGGDNIGVYIPLLTTMSSADKIQLVVIFIIMTYLWCQLADFLATRPLVAKRLDKSGHIIMPIVLFCLGIFILIESGTFSLI